MFLKKRTCVVCGTEFRPTNFDQKVCGKRCAIVRKRELARERYHEKRKREGFTTRRNNPQRHGSQSKTLAESHVVPCRRCGSVVERNNHQRQCDVCGAFFFPPIAGVDIPPPDAVQFKNLLLPPDALRRLLEIREKMGLPD